MHLTRDQVQVLARLNRLPEGQALLAILAMLQGELDAALRKARGEDVFRAQGAAAQIDILVGWIQEAQGKLERQAAAPQRPAALA